MRTTILLVVTLFLFFPIHSQVHVWGKWTKSFKSKKYYENPYADVSVKITFKGPGNIMYNTFCYWTGENNFEANFCFPLPGKWKWTISCSDKSNKSLNRKRGSIRVLRYSGTNPLYQNGFLKVSESKRHLAYNNNVPFLWMGCTAWAGPANSQLGEWKDYIDDRARKHFTIIQVTPFQNWNRRDTMHTAQLNLMGQEPFSSFYKKINPVFWEDLARKVDYANEKGLVVALTGLPGWQFNVKDPADRQIFARYLTGLFAGNFVLFSPSGDKAYSVENDYLAMDIDSFDNRHLITQHPDTPTGKSTNIASEAYYDKDYLDFSMCQSGHNYGKRDICVWNAIHWNRSLFNRVPHKPVINAEPFYHGNPLAQKETYRGTDNDVRSLGWYSWLSGSLGYTYGALGLWNWGMTTSNVFVPWRDAMNLNSSFQMQYMADFFRSVNWWELEPCPNAILNQPPQDPVKQIVLAKNRSGSLAVAYIPGDVAPEIDMNLIKSPAVAIWFNPRENYYLAANRFTDNKNSRRFEPPHEPNKDWVLLLQSKIEMEQTKTNLNEQSFF